MPSPPRSGDSTIRIGGYPLPPICTFRRLTGLPCPGCGMARSLTAAVHGDFMSSWSFHRLGIITLFYLTAQMILRLFFIAVPGSRPRLLYGTRFLDRGLIVVAVLFVLNWGFTLIRLM